MAPRPLDPSTFDDVAVLRLIAGQAVKARTVDYWEAARRLAGLGWSDGQIAHHLNKSRRQIMVSRQRVGAPAAIPRKGGNQHSLKINAPSRPRTRK